MNREGAETYLRLLAEAAMRGSLAPAAELRAPGASRILVVGHALTVVSALGDSGGRWHAARPDRCH
jgi:hypothetical protein